MHYSVYVGTRKDWVYEAHDKNAPQNEYHRLQSFKHLWDSKRKDDALPAWKDFQLDDFKEWYGWLSVEDVVPSPQYDATFRLFGTSLVMLYGADPTGKRISEIEGPFFLPMEHEISAALVREKLVVVSNSPKKWQQRNFINIGVLELPLADDGYSDDKVMVLYRKIEDSGKRP